MKVGLLYRYLLLDVLADDFLDDAFDLEVVSLILHLCQILLVILAIVETECCQVVTGSIIASLCGLKSSELLVIILSHIIPVDTISTH